MGNRIILFDTETTGLPKPSLAPLNEQPYIIEFYGVAVDDEFNPIDELETYLKPPILFENKITEITGIKNEDVENSPTFSDMYDRFCEFFLGTTHMVAHNLMFDSNMLYYELQRMDKLINFPWPKNHICTVEHSLHIKGYRLKLAQLHQELLGKGFENAHRAKNDVYALVRCFHALVERGDITL